MNNKKSAVQLSLMIFLTLLSQVIALYKSRFTAVTFGATNYMDAYNYALNVATFVFAFITTGVTTVIIPAYVNKTDKKAVNSFITIIYSITLIVVWAVIIFRKPLLEVLTNRGQNFIDIVGDFLIVAFIIQGLLAFQAVTAGFYQCNDHYNVPKFITLMANLIVAIVLITGAIKNIYAYLALLVFGSILNFTVDVLAAVKYGFRYTPAFDLKNNELKKMLIVFLPTLFSSGVYKIHTMVDTTIAANLLEGQITILSYSTQIITMVNNVIVGNLTVYAYPKIVSRLHEKGSKQNFWDYSILFHAVIVLLICGFINVGYEGVGVIFQGGKFTKDNTWLLYVCTCVYIFGQQFNIIRDLIYRYFYAQGNTKETFKNSVLVSVLTIVLSVILVKFVGLLGIILGTVMSSFISLIMIILRFRREYGLGVKFSGILLECSKNLVAAIVTVVVVQLLKGYTNFSNILSLLIFGLLTVVIYCILLLLLKTRVRHIRF